MIEGTGTVSETVNEIVIIVAVEGNGREVRVQIDTDLRRVGLRSPQKMATCFTNHPTCRHTPRQRPRQASTPVAVPLTATKRQCHTYTKTIASKSSTIRSWSTIYFNYCPKKRTSTANFQI
jgi:hypothetical protein